MKWCTDDNVDGLTTNGVFLMQPQGGFSPLGKPGHWREVSVGGALFSLRDSRPSPLKSHQVTALLTTGSVHLDFKKLIC